MGSTILFEFDEYNFTIEAMLMNKQFCDCRRYISAGDLTLYSHHYHRLCWSSTVRINIWIYHPCVGQCGRDVALTIFVCPQSNHEMIEYLFSKGLTIGLYLLLTEFRVQKCFYHLFHCIACYGRYK